MPPCVVTDPSSGQVIYNYQPGGSPPPAAGSGSTSTGP
jgi:hypothetical protein